MAEAAPAPNPGRLGRHDLTFPVAGAKAFRGDLPNADIVILDAGHFVMDTRLDEVAKLTRQFLQRLNGCS